MNKRLDAGWALVTCGWAPQPWPNCWTHPSHPGDHTMDRALVLLACDRMKRYAETRQLDRVEQPRITYEHLASMFTSWAW